jgi:hypothetical protein
VAERCWLAGRPESSWRLRTRRSMWPGFSRRNPAADLDGFAIEWMATKQTDTFDRLASEAIRQGADTTEIEYKDGSEEVYFMKGGAGSGITLPGSSPKVKSLLRELHGIAKHGQRVTVVGCEYIYESASGGALARMPFACPSGACVPERSVWCRRD